MRLATATLLLLLDGLRGFGETLDFESLGRLQESGKLVLGDVDLSGIHELQDGGQMLQEINVALFNLRSTRPSMGFRQL